MKMKLMGVIYINKNKQTKIMKPQKNRMSSIKNLNVRIEIVGKFRKVTYTLLYRAFILRLYEAHSFIALFILHGNFVWLLLQGLLEEEKQGLLNRLLT